MNINRRRFLETATATAVLAGCPRFEAHAAVNTDYALDIRPGDAGLLEDKKLKTAIWGYDGQVPGPILRAKQGRPLSIKVTNRLKQSTSVHWHGLRIVNAMDGVPGLTQEPIDPGESFTYRFTPPDAGTYWYHPHLRSWEQVARGLYGTLIVEEPDAPDMDRDFVLVADDWRLGEDGAIDEASFGNLHDWSHGGRLGNILTLNGKPYERLHVNAGERIRLRLINTATARVMRFGILDQQAWIIAHDGQPVEPRLLDAAGIDLSPGQRTDLMVDLKATPGDEIPIIETSTGERLVAGYLVCATTPAKTLRAVSRPGSMMSNPVPSPDLTDALDVDLVMTGGAMRFLQSATYKGKTYDGRTLAMEHSQTWAFNGIAGMPSEPLFSVPRGRTVKLKLRNDTRWPHNIHLHGHHFVQMPDTAMDAPANNRAGALQDTVLIDTDKAADIAFLADNPGKWMIHCHMLEHQASGMASWFEVT